MFTWTRVKKRLRVGVVRRKNLSYQTHKEAARELIHQRLAYFNQAGEFVYNRIAIKDQRRCWGSCSSQGNLNFSYKLLFLPACLRDYVIIHELCHLKVLNHSQGFWDVVQAHMPDYKLHMQTLRKLEKTIGTSIGALKKYQLAHNCQYCDNEINEISMRSTIED